MATSTNYGALYLEFHQQERKPNSMGRTRNHGSVQWQSDCLAREIRGIRKGRKPEKKERSQCVETKGRPPPHTFPPPPSNIIHNWAHLTTYWLIPTLSDQSQKPRTQPRTPNVSGGDPRSWLKPAAFQSVHFSRKLDSKWSQAGLSQALSDAVSKS